MSENAPIPSFPGLPDGPAAVPVLLLLAVALVVALPIARRRAWAASFRRALTFSLLLVLATLAAILLPSPAGASGGPYLRVLVHVLAWMTAAELLQWLVFDLVLGRLLKRPTAPRILRDFLTLLVGVAALFLALRGTLGVDLASLIATSAMLSVVLGLALQDTLGSFFSGLALQMERPLGMGDWVQIGEFQGQVTQVSWRSVRVRTLEEDEVTVPNAVIARSTLTNFSRPTPAHMHTIDVRVHFRHPPSEVIAAIEGAMCGIDGILARPASHALLWAYGETAITYRARFYLDNYARVNRLKSVVGARIWYALRRAGFEVPHPGVVLHRPTAEVGGLPAPPTAAALGAVDIFAPLSEKERCLLAERLRPVTFGRGETVIRQGDQGDSLFLLTRGEVEVSVASGGEERVVGTLGPGSVFGEMSLLTGEPRAATVSARTDADVTAVTREDFRHIVAANPAVLEAVTRVVSNRRGHLRDTIRETEEAAAVRLAAHQDLLERVRSFFAE